MQALTEQVVQWLGLAQPGLEAVEQELLLKLSELVSRSDTVIACSQRIATHEVRFRTPSHTWSRCQTALQPEHSDSDLLISKSKLKSDSLGVVWQV